MPKLAHDIKIQRRGNGHHGSIEIDGQEFPYHVTEDIMACEDGSGIAKLTVEILYDGTLHIEGAD